MEKSCHRCHAELPARGSSGSERGGIALTDEALLFCPHCSAPQICLPEHMRRAGDSAPKTTGTAPPPRVDAEQAEQAEQIDWRAALQSGALVAVVGAALSVGVIELPALGFFSVVWILSSGAVALTLYLRRTPAGWMNARGGWKIGMATGLLLVTANGMAVAGTYCVERFLLHGMGDFDHQQELQSRDAQERVLEWMGGQNVGRDVEQRYVSLMNSPEVRAGSMLFGQLLEGGLVLLLAAGSGAFAGALRTRRALAGHRD